ncbi:flavin reductase family protein [Homoserinimonas sp. OAct 916]|uniref:flavin reductase family protein n=1 Tax=Homoserinimonas sp. OAct 916 TaxID=2211450 RepID=UPI000DBE1C34|nr:flavin reductase family protein [Homoserinimonas sp. OAct 916]
MQQETTPPMRTLTPELITTEDQEFYQALSATVAKGVAVVSSRYRGRDMATTVTDYLSISYDPPTMLASLYALSRTVDAIEDSGRFAVSVLAADQRGTADWLGELGSPLIGLLDNVPHFRAEPEAPAVIRDCLAWFELRTVASHRAGTHTLFVGEVVRMGESSDQSRGPLIRYQSGYRRL